MSMLKQSTKWTVVTVFCSLLSQTMLAQNTTSCDAAGTTVEVEGFIMDNYCIELGLFPDRPDFTPFGNPEKHTIHCLVDVSECIDSGFAVLELLEGAEQYSIKYQLGPEGTRLTADAAFKARADDGMSEGFSAVLSGIDDGTDELKCVRLLESRSLADTTAEDQSTNEGKTQKKNDDQSSGSIQCPSSWKMVLLSLVGGATFWTLL